MVLYYPLNPVYVCIYIHTHSWESVHVCTLERIIWVGSKVPMWEASLVAIAAEFSKL